VTIRVLIADDQALVRSGFRMILEARPDLEVVGEAEDGEQAVELARTTEPDVVLMDVRMPGLGGIEATRRIVESGSRTRVLVLTTFDVDEYVHSAIRAGASGFLLKDVRGNRLTEAIRTVAAGEALLAPAITRRLIEDFVSRAPSSVPVAPPAVLTEREAEVLRLLAAGLTNAEIAERLFVEHSTVKTHVTRLLTKLGLRDRAQAVVFAYESGFVRPGTATG